MGSIDRMDIAEICSVPEGYEVDTLLSLGYPDEAPLTCGIKDGDTKYFLDEKGVLNVPKHDIKDLIL
jgi:hypothetical protein